MDEFEVKLKNADGAPVLMARLEGQNVLDTVAALYRVVKENNPALAATIVMIEARPTPLWLREIGA